MTLLSKTENFSKGVAFNHGERNKLKIIYLGLERVERGRDEEEWG